MNKPWTVQFFVQIFSWKVGLFFWSWEVKKIRKEVSRCTSWVEFSELRELFSDVAISWIRSDSKILLLELYKSQHILTDNGWVEDSIYGFNQELWRQTSEKQTYLLLSENQNRLFRTCNALRSVRPSIMLAPCLWSKCKAEIRAPRLIWSNIKIGFWGSKGK